MNDKLHALLFRLPIKVYVFSLVGLFFTIGVINSIIKILVKQ